MNFWTRGGGQKDFAFCRSCGKRLEGLRLKNLWGEKMSDIVAETIDILKVSAKSNPNSVAGALAGVLRQKGSAELQAIGAGAINQAIKGVAIARGFVAPGGMDLTCVPAFMEVQINGEVRTAIRLIVELK